MYVEGIGQFKSFKEFLSTKANEYAKSDRKLSDLFGFMFSEKQNIFAEISEGYKIKKITYGQAYESVFALAPAIKSTLDGIERGSIIGLYMNNCPEFIETLWAILMCGYKPLLLNTRMNQAVLEDLIAKYGVKGVISDGKTFYSTKTFDVQEIIKNAKRQSDFTPDWEDEIIFMTSGTTGDAKLCFYNGENFYYQVKNSMDIVDVCPDIAKHYQGQLRQLALLPFYHVFGFTAVYLWFGFYSRTFVFLKDLSPKTLLTTVRRHKVTHIFAVPLVWESFYKEAIKKIKARGDKTYKKVLKGVKLANKFAFISKHSFKKLREQSFGDSICFMISGGSGIKKEVLEFFNAIGYRLANGFGMTEVGITSVGTIGMPFKTVDYKIDQNGELLIKSSARASKIIQGDTVTVTNYDEWFNSHDLTIEVDGRYFINGRKDDLIICENGENLNPELVESKVVIDGADAVCIFADKNGTPTLLVSAPKCYSVEKFKEIEEKAILALKQAQLDSLIKKIAVTPDKLLGENDFKISRKKVAEKYADGRISAITPSNPTLTVLNALEKEVTDLFKEVLGYDGDISIDADFFTALNGSSLDYFALLESVKTKYNVVLPIEDGKTLTTVKDVCEFLKNH